MKTKTCDGCGNVEPATQQDGNYIDDGWSFEWPSLGHYGGFTDWFLDLPEHREDHIVHMCHDCCVKLLETFPNFVAKMKPFGGHHNRNHDPESDNGLAYPPCCPFAWTWVKNDKYDKNKDERMFINYRSTPELTWEQIDLLDSDDEDDDPTE